MYVPSSAIILILLCLLAMDVSGRTVRQDDYPVRRPIKYFFHLLQLKADVNPLLTHITSNELSCSSKHGPYCRMAGHSPLQRHKMKTLSPEMQNIYNMLQAVQSRYEQLLAQIDSGNKNMFLIRQDLMNQYENYIKGQLGDVMHKQNMLPQELILELN